MDNYMVFFFLQSLTLYTARRRRGRGGGKELRIPEFIVHSAKGGKKGQKVKWEGFADSTRSIHSQGSGRVLIHSQYCFLNLNNKKDY